MTISTLIATISTYISTRIISYLKKKSVRFRKIKSTWVALLVSIIIVFLIYLVAPSLQKGGIDIPQIPKLGFDVLVAWITSGGIYQANKSLRGRDRSPTMTTGGSDPELYEDFLNDATTYLVPVSSTEGDMYYPIEYFFNPTIISKLFVESIGDPDVMNSDMGVGMISHMLLFKLKPFKNAVFSGKVDKVVVPWIYLVDPNVEIDLFNYAVLEHSVVATLIGGDKVRTVVSEGSVFNVFYTGGRWFMVSNFKEYNINPEHMYLNHRGVIKPSGDVYLKIKNGVFSGTSNVREMLADIWKAGDLKKDMDERSGYPGYVKFLKKVWSSGKV